MKKKHLTAMPQDLTAARDAISSVRSTIAHLLDDSEMVKGKAWKRLNKVYQSLESADRELRQAQEQLDQVMPKLLKQLDKQR